MGGGGGQNTVKLSLRIDGVGSVSFFHRLSDSCPRVQTCTWSWRTWRGASPGRASWTWSWASAATTRSPRRRSASSRSGSTRWWRRSASWSSACGWVTCWPFPLRKCARQRGLKPPPAVRGHVFPLAAAWVDVWDDVRSHVYSLMISDEPSQLWGFFSWGLGCY